MTQTKTKSNLLKDNTLSGYFIEKRRPPRYDQRRKGERFCPRTIVVKGREIFPMVVGTSPQVRSRRRYFFAKKAFGWYDALTTFPPYHTYLDIQTSPLRRWLRQDILKGPRNRLVHETNRLVQSLWVQKLVYKSPCSKPVWEARVQSPCVKARVCKTQKLVCAKPRVYKLVCAKARVQSSSA